LLDPALRSNIGHFAGLPARHGMTMGELARMFNAETSMGADLTVIPVEDWHRGDWFDATGLAWINPSPNMRSLNAATLYPGLAQLEYSKGYSVGRGTDAELCHVATAFPEKWTGGQNATAGALNFSQPRGLFFVFAKILHRLLDLCQYLAGIHGRHLMTCPHCSKRISDKIVLSVVARITRSRVQNPGRARGAKNVRGQKHSAREMRKCKGRA
jgi:hypothetical protein